MNLSKLQVFIVKRCFLNGRLKKRDFLDFYKGKKINREVALKDITRSLDRLIARDQLQATGVKTAKKWYTKSVILTAKGRKTAKKILSDQQKLPLKKK